MLNHSQVKDYFALLRPLGEFAGFWEAQAAIR